MTAVALKEFSWQRMIAAVEDVRERACRATEALKQASIAHVVIGGNAVAAWVVRVDRQAVRNTKDVDLLEVGLIDETWYTRLPPELVERLKSVVASRDEEA